METTYHTMTTEHLGSDATEEDLDAFVAACERVAQSREFRGRDALVTDFVWNHGSIRFNAGVCDYCERAILDTTCVPGVADDAAWDLIAIEHDADCEWVATRAHRTVAIELAADTETRG